MSTTRTFLVPAPTATPRGAALVDFLVDLFRKDDSDGRAEREAAELRRIGRALANDLFLPADRQAAPGATR